MSKILDTFGGILMCLAEILIGILLLINPLGFTSGIIMGLGVLLLVMGAMSVVSYFRTSAAEAARQQSLAKGLGLMLTGAFCALKSEWFIAAFPLLTVIYGVIILVTGLVRIQWTVDTLRLKKGQVVLAGDRRGAGADPLVGYPVQSVRHDCIHVDLRRRLADR